MIVITSRHRSTKYFWLFWVVISIWALVSCTAQSEINATDRPAPLSSPTQNTEVLATSESTESPTLTATSKPIPSVTPTPHISLSSTGPWLIFSTYPNAPEANAGLWAFNPDGTGVTHLLRARILPLNIEQSISPNGRNIAVITSSDTSLVLGLTLHILDVSQQSEVATIPLTSEATEPVSSEWSEEPIYQTALTLSTAGLAWSPDGQNLAFVAAFEDTTADVYLYSINTNEVHRVSTETGNAVRPIWSSDGTQLAYGVVDNSAGISTATSVDSIWLTNIADESARLLYTPSPGGEEILGWIDSDTLLVTSWLDNCGRHGVRELNVETGQQRTLWSDNFKEVVIAPSQDKILLSAGEIYGHCNPTTSQQGIFLISTDTGEAQQVSANNAGLIASWIPDLSQFLVTTEVGELLLISLSGESKSLPTEPDLVPVISPNGSWIAWYGPDDGIGRLALTSVDDTESTELFDQPVTQVLWSKASTTLYFLGRRGVYILPQLDGTFSPVIERVMPLDLVWMNGSE